MELSEMTRVLWRLRLLVAVGVLLAAVVAILVGFHVSLSPLTVRERSTTVGAAEQSIFVDSTRSALVQRGNGLSDLIGRAQVIGRMVNTEAVKTQAARAIGVPPGRITVEGPNPNGPQFQTAEPSAQQRANQVLGEAADYRVLVDTDPEAPLITLFTQAPTGAKAVELSTAVSRALRRSVERISNAARPDQLQEVRDALAALPPAQRSTSTAADARNRRRELLSEGTRVRILGPAVGGNVSNQTGKLMVLATFVGVLGAWCVLLLLLTGAARSGRRR